MRMRWAGWAWVEGSWRKVCEEGGLNRCAVALARFARKAGIKDPSRLALSGGKPPDRTPQPAPGGGTVPPE